ncbi:DUF2303 family protein [Altericroceibacterium spongiae]|uniref:DUF2303 family protein n=1 Tax=Altericroceibacterium spongiae TaxID=2320269 RepID=A0A420ERU8_9SPHN|nr:DUF2303 family protein [Altericroceibacterium spongiae]RKF23360.1 DUF2303 family protein [Altericroceibacterium spongiae]
MSDFAQQRGTAAEVREIIETYKRPEIETLVEPGTGVEAIVQISSHGTKVIPSEVFDEYRRAPSQRYGTASLTAIESLIDHVNRFKDADSVLFAIDDRTKPSITAVLDYHRAGAESDPRYGLHRSLFQFPLSDEWKAWTKYDGEPFKMAEFAAFLEDRIIDVLDLIPGEDSLPEDMQRFVNTVGGSIASPSKLIELSVGLKVNERSAVKEAINLSSGEGQVQFVAEHVDDVGAPLRVPGLFLIGIPVFNKGPIYRLAARLRYRKTAEGLVFYYQLWRADRTFDHSFREACERVQVETELPMMFGTPE